MKVLNSTTIKSHYGISNAEIRTEHRRIYEAVQARNTEAATQAIKAHLVASKERVVREMKNLQQTHGIVQEG